MASQINYRGNVVQPTPSDWQVYVKGIIDDRLAVDPNFSNAQQLAIMNAVKVSAGVIDNASPFKASVNEDVAVEANQLQSAGLLADTFYDVNSSIKSGTGIDVSATIAPIGRGAEALVGGIFDWMGSVGTSVTKALSETSDIKDYLLFGAIIAGVAVFVYAKKNV